MATSMASSGDVADGEKTAAQRLMEKHDATDNSSHKTTMEEVVDEEDILHPPPSGLPSVAAGTNGISEKAAGKQPEAPATSNAAPKKAALDTKSEELFPALGAPKSRAPAPSTWSRKPAVVSQGGAINGTNGVSRSNVGSGTATPVSGVLTPTVSAMVPGVGLPKMNLPGRWTEQVSFAPSQLLPRSQLKKPVQDVLRDINKRSKADVKMSVGPNNAIIFEGTGPVEAVRQALKDVAKELGSKQSTKVTIPASVRPHIIGKGGANISKLSSRTGARIQVPRTEASEGLGEDDDSVTVDVLIEGDAISAEMARREIEAIVNERTSTVNLRLKDIPHEYYPFLAGPHGTSSSRLQEGRDIRVQIPDYHRWAGHAPARGADARGPAQFVPQGRLPISISGDRRAALEARAQIERRVEELRQRLAIEELLVERGRHQFIIGEKGAALHDFLQETGCAIIFPPDEHDSETIAIIGPPDKLEEASNKVMELASSMALTSVDIARVHANAANGGQVHARNVSRYLQDRNALQALEKTHNARIYAQTGPNASSNWEVYSREGVNAMKARSDIMNLIAGHPPSRFAPVQIDPFYHQHLRQQAVTHVRDQYGVHLMVPEQFSEEPEVLLVFEGGESADFQFPRRAPAPAEVKQAEQSLQEARLHILGLCSGHDNIISRDLDAPIKFHDKLRRHVGRQQDSLPQGQIPVQVQIGGSAQQRKATNPQVSLRGPEVAVEELLKNLVAFLEQEEKDELERGFTASFDFPQAYANQLIGKGGSNIKKLRDEFDVDIQVNDGKVELKGPEAKANACKAHIKSLEKRLADEATHHLKIAPQFHKNLIGPKGAQINRLQDRYNVRINFPRSNVNDGDDDASVAGGEGQRRSNQAPDEVIVRGPRKGADEARDELLSLLQYVKDNSNAATISVAQSQIPSLIGSGGRELEALRLATGAQIDVPNKDEVDASGRVEVTVRGTKTAVAEAKKRIEEAAKTFDNTTTREIEVDKKHHRTIIGGGGEGIRKLVLAAGGPDDRQKINRMVRFPRADDQESNKIKIEGPTKVVDQIVAQIQQMVNEKDSQTIETVTVPSEKHRQLIGRGGETRRQLESQFSVSIDIPKQTVTGPAREQVKISGQPDNVAKAKAHITELVKDQEATTIQVPLKYHHTISDNGQLFRRLRSDHKVTVDHGGQKPPGKAAAPTPKRSGALPLITDDASSAPTGHSWETHSLHSDAEGEIPWILSGPSATEIAAAQRRIENALAEAGKADTTGFLILPDPRSYRLVIGPGGSEINRIRKETGTKIQVPGGKGSKGEAGEAIEIVGSKQGVEKARDEILKVVG